MANFLQSIQATPSFDIAGESRVVVEVDPSVFALGVDPDSVKLEGRVFKVNTTAAANGLPGPDSLAAGPFDFEERENQESDRPRWWHGTIDLTGSGLLTDEPIYVVVSLVDDLENDDGATLADKDEVSSVQMTARTI